MAKYKKSSDECYIKAVIDGIEYKVYYTTDTNYYGGIAWLIETDKGGQRIYPATCSPDWAIRHWASGNKPLKKVIYN